MDFSGFDRDQCKLRNGLDHAKKTAKLLECNTQRSLDSAEKECGGRYLVLTQLIYFDAPRMLIVLRVNKARFLKIRAAPH